MPDWIVSLPDRLDVFLSKEGRIMSRAQAQAMIEAGLAAVNEETVRKPAHRLQEGDRVTLTGDVLRSETPVTAIDLQLPILYEDGASFVLEKPAGLTVHPGAGMGSDEQTVLHGIAHLFEERGLPFRADSVLAHRLDRETTGCLLVAKTPQAHRVLQKQFEDRTIEKQYLALVAGLPSPPHAVIDAPIGRATFERTKMSVTAINRAREARTTYRTMGTSEHAALLLCDLHTGRTHQLRVHLHAIGHPILGDPTYTTSLSERLTEEYGIARLCLHAWKLAFDSPADGKRPTVTAPLPTGFEEILHTLKITMSKT